MAAQEPTEEKAEEVELSAEKVSKLYTVEKQKAEIAELKNKLEEL